MKIKTIKRLIFTIILIIGLECIFLPLSTVNFPLTGKQNISLMQLAKNSTNLLLNKEKQVKALKTLKEILSKSVPPEQLEKINSSNGWISFAIIAFSVVILIALFLTYFCVAIFGLLEKSYLTRKLAKIAIFCSVYLALGFLALNQLIHFHARNIKFDATVDFTSGIYMMFLKQIRVLPGTALYFMAFAMLTALAIDRFLIRGETCKQT